MKAGLNGVPQLGTLDGWWQEGYDGLSGWAITPAGETEDADAADVERFYRLLEDHVIPLYYAIGPGGYSPGWLTIAKQSIASIVPRFSSVRMLGEYAEQLRREISRASNPTPAPRRAHR